MAERLPDIRVNDLVYPAGKVANGSSDRDIERSAEQLGHTHVSDLVSQVAYVYVLSDQDTRSELNAIGAQTK